MGIYIVSWRMGLVDNVNCTGDVICLPHYPYKTVQVSGTFNGATVHIMGCNDIGKNEWCLLEDTEDGAALSIADDKLKTLSQNPMFIRPEMVDGDSSTAVTVTLMCRRD
jgi:hypothetical protein